jgi:hypothetical protein
MNLHRVIAVACATLFLAFAALQYNDPDPLVWIAIYVAMAALCIWSAFGQLPRVVPILAMLAALVGAYLLWPTSYQGLSGKMDSRPGVELARESLGLLLCALTCGYLAWRGVARLK